MTICAGYLSPVSVLDSQRVKDIIKTFSVLSQNSVNREVVRVFRTKYGHQVCKFSLDMPALPYMAEDSQGNFLMMLGFIRGDWIQKKEVVENGLLQLVVEKGPQTLEKQEGQFVAIFVEGPSGTVHIVNDRFASRPFYVLRTKAATFYASNLAFLFKLANVNPTPDILGWLQIFRFGHTLGTRTNCTDAKRLRPATHVTITSSSVTEIPYWKLEHKPEIGLDPDVFADEIFEAFQESAAWRAKRVPRSIIALSGGLDSRLVAACVPRGVDATAFTFVNSTESTKTPEVLVASELAFRLGLPHEIKRMELEAYSKTAESVVRLTDGLLALHHPSKTMQYIDKLGRRCTYLMGGGPGDSLAGAFVSSPAYLDPSRTTELVEQYCANRGLSPPPLSRIFADNVLNEFLPKLDASILESFSGLTGPTAAHRVTAWAMAVRQPAFTFTTPFHNHPQFEEGTAHLGYRYSDLMLKLPADWILFKNFYKYMIHRCLPQLRDVIYANTGEPLPGRLYKFDYKAVGPISRRAKLKSALKKLPFAQRIRDLMPRELTLYRQYTFDYSILRGDGGLLASTEDMLDLPSVSELVDKQRCRSFVQKFRRGQIQISSDADASLLASLATLCFSMKNYSEVACDTVDS